jgi:hypothetical protein
MPSRKIRPSILNPKDSSHDFWTGLQGPINGNSARAAQAAATESGLHLLPVWRGKAQSHSVLLQILRNLLKNGNSRIAKHASLTGIRRDHHHIRSPQASSLLRHSSCNACLSRIVIRVCRYSIKPRPLHSRKIRLIHSLRAPTMDASLV